MQNAAAAMHVHAAVPCDLGKHAHALARATSVASTLKAILNSATSMPGSSFCKC